MWTASALGLGLAFRSRIEELLAWLAAFGRMSLWVLLLAVVGWVLAKWVERRRFYRLLERSRISAPELKERLAALRTPL